MKRTTLIIASSGALAALPALAIAQPYSITWSSIDGGGTAGVAAGTYSLGGAIGQPAAGTLIAANLECRGGFWSAESPAPAACYPNCDASTAPPILNVNDFTCFLNNYAAGDSYANCDHSTVPPVLNINDFTCFLNHYAAGCR